MRPGGEDQDENFGPEGLLGQESVHLKPHHIQQVYETSPFKQTWHTVGSGTQEETCAHMRSQAALKAVT